MSFILFLGLFAGHAPAAAPALGPCDRWIPATPPARGVVLLTHGLNLLPSRMDDMGAALAAEGFEVLRPAFTGHCHDGEALRSIKAEQWIDDARRFHALASERAGKLKAPLFLCAYSFSGLVFQVLDRELPFERKVLFAPALETHFWYPLVVWIAGLMPNFAMRTMVPEGYYASERSGFRPVLALDEFHRRWEKGEGKGGTTPVLVLVDPADELVSGLGLEALAASQKNWKLEKLSVAGSTLEKSYHHLVINEESVGPTEWKRAMGLVLKFLKGN